jgi:hypothetical protein
VSNCYDSKQYPSNTMTQLTNAAPESPTPDVSPSDDVSNAATIAVLAEETHQPPPLVKQIFDEQYAHLKASARITDYLILFATRRTKDALKRRS